jgi:glycosyltransferase involved in cell wall biosynthesis
MQHKLAMIEPVGGHRGNELFLYNLCSGLQDAGCHTTLYTCDETNFDAFHKPHFDVKKYYRRIYGCDPVLLRGLRYLKGSYQTVQDCHRQGVNIAHLHIYHFANREFVNQLLLQQQQIKTVLTIHDVEDFVKFGQTHTQKKYRRFEKRNPHTIVLSQYAKKKLMHYFPNTPQEQIHVIPLTDKDTLYYNPERTKAEARKALGLNPDDFIVMFFGQIKKVKGLDVLIDGFARALKGKSDAKLLIAGIPWKVGFDAFEKQIQEHQLGEQSILRLQYHPNEVKPDYFAAADIVVLPYREIFSSGVLVNAMHYRSAIICSDLPFFREYVKDGYDCLMFESENAESLAEQLSRVYDNRSLPEQLKGPARLTADTIFNTERIVEQTIKVYDQVMGS